MTTRWTQTVPVMLEVQLSLVRDDGDGYKHIRGSVELNFDIDSVINPFWFRADVKVEEDGSFEIFSFEPLFGGAVPSGQRDLMNPYRDTLKKAIERSKLKLLGY